MGCFSSIMDAIEQPGYRRSDILDGKPYTMAVGAPTFPMLQRIILPTYLGMIPRSFIIGKYHQTKKLLRVRGKKGESNVYFLSGKAFEAWMGLSLYRAWIDEFAQVSEKLFDEVQVRLMDTHGRLWLTGTPQGPNWAFQRVYKPWKEVVDARKNGRINKIDSDHPGRKIDFFTWSTIRNPYIDKKVVLLKRKTMPSRFFRRTFLATWETFAGQVYEEWMEETHVKSWRKFRFKLPNGRFVGSGENTIPLIKIVSGVDWGFASGHSGVIVVGGIDTARRWWLLEESVAEQVPVLALPGSDCWVSRGRELSAKWGIDRFYCDTEDPEAIHQFRKAGLPAAKANKKSVMAGIGTVSKYMHIDPDSCEPNLYCMETLATTRDEHTYYHFKEGKEEPEKVNDNTCDAVRYMIHSQEGRMNFRREPNYSPE